MQCVCDAVAFLLMSLDAVQSLADVSEDVVHCSLSRNLKCIHFISNCPLINAY